ncbi:MAG: type II toxin-antitoxin system RelE/ParE family toxin [Bacteroidota bacterium]
MAAIIWTPQARRDLEAIEDYYLVVAPHYASVVVDGLLGSTRRLELFARSGRAVPEISAPMIREVVW